MVIMVLVCETGGNTKNAVLVHSVLMLYPYTHRSLSLFVQFMKYNQINSPDLTHLPPGFILRYRHRPLLDKRALR